MSCGTGSVTTVYTNAMSVRISPNKVGLAVRRVFLTLVAVILLHVLAIDWADRNIQVLQTNDQTPPPIVEVQLAPPPPPPAAEPKPKPHAFKPKPKPRPQQEPSAPASTIAAEPPPDPNADPGNVPAPMPAADGDAASKPMSQDVASAPDANAQDKPDDKAEDKSAPVHYKLEFPPSAELKYDVQKVPGDGGNPSYGSGIISWQNGGGKYQVNGEADVLFFTLIKFTSAGNFDSYGIAPVLYSEKRIRHSETATHFNRDERNNISFSASTLSYPIKGGEQDTSSVVWEISGIGRGDREKFVPGAQIDLFVAGTRDADIWSILVVGQEEIEIDHGKMQTWHVVRIPRTGSYDRKIDIWLAPQDQWYPVKIRQTEKNGDYFDMTMTSVRALPDQAAR